MFNSNRSRNQPRPNSPFGIAPGGFPRLIDRLRRSDRPLEQSACYLGTVAADGSPILVDRSLLREHVHFLGDTGGGKTSTGVNPLIEQLISFGDSTVIIIDLKGDSQEMLASAHAARDRLAARTGHQLPIRYFSLETNRPTHAFNPLASAGWLGMPLQQRASVLCGACGLFYGTNYGPAFFSASNNAVVTAAERLQTKERTFATLHRDLSQVVSGGIQTGLMQEIRRSGIHPVEAIGRLAAVAQLNVTSESPVFSDSIDLADCFRTPQIVYFHLPASITADSSGVVARLAAYFLMCCGQGIKNRRQVYVVVDEFQRMAADNLSALLQLSRSLDISLILSNQSIEDLGERGSGLLNVIETNCHVRQWFTVSGRKDLSLLETLGGHREVDDVTSSVRYGKDGRSVSYSKRTVKIPRITVDDALYISNQTDLSILKITGSRRGYSQYRGLPFVTRSQFHITEEEYERRRNFPWPELREGMMLSAELQLETTQKLNAAVRTGRSQAIPARIHPGSRSAIGPPRGFRSDTVDFNESEKNP